MHAARRSSLSYKTYRKAAARVAWLTPSLRCRADDVLAEVDGVAAELLGADSHFVDMPLQALVRILAHLDMRALLQLNGVANPLICHSADPELLRT